MGCSNIWIVNWSDESNVWNLYMIIYKYGVLCYELFDGTFDVERYSTTLRTLIVLPAVESLEEDGAVFSTYLHDNGLRGAVLAELLNEVFGIDRWLTQSMPPCKSWTGEISRIRCVSKKSGKEYTQRRKIQHFDDPCRCKMKSMVHSALSPDRNKMENGFARIVQIIKQRHSEGFHYAGANVIAANWRGNHRVCNRFVLVSECAWRFIRALQECSSHGGPSDNV